MNIFDIAIYKVTLKDQHYLWIRAVPRPESAVAGYERQPVIMGRQNGVAATRTRSKNPLQYARISLTYALTIAFSYYTTYLVVSELHFMRSSKRQSQGAGKFVYIRTDHKYFHQKLRMKNIHHNLFFPQFDEASFEKKITCHGISIQMTIFQDAAQNTCTVLW